jgi:hypothetical protein
MVSLTDTPGQIEGLVEFQLQIPADFSADGKVTLAAYESYGPSGTSQSGSAGYLFIQ